MSNRFKSGDLALTIKDGAVLPAMSQVQLDSRIREGSEVCTTNGEVYIAQPGLWRVMADGKPYAYHENYLMPLRGDFVLDQSRAEDARRCE